MWSGVFEWGDVDEALAEADHVVKIERLHFHRFASTPLECAGALVEYDKGTQEWTLHCNHQMPGVGAIWMAPALRTGIDKLRFVTQDIGGGFGNKICLHPQFVVLCLMARKLGRPVQWTEWRTDQHTANAHGNERTFLDVEVAVKADGTMTGFKVRALDDCGAFPRYEPLGLHHLGAGHPGAVRVAEHPRRLHAGLHEQVSGLPEPRLLTDAAPVADRAHHRHRRGRALTRSRRESGRRTTSRPSRCRTRRRTGASTTPVTTPPRSTSVLELIDHGSIEERRKEAAERGKLLGFGIGSTLDSGTNNFGQSTLLNPDLQFSGNNEAASVKLDIFGEVVVTLGTVPQGQGHETTAAQVVADILGCSPDQVNVRRGHDTWFNSHAGFSGTYASQFAFTGLGAVKGAAELLRDDMVQLAAAVLQAPVEAIELADGFARIKDGPPEAALPFMALGAIVNANNAFLPPDFNPTLNHRYVCRPYFGMVDTEKKTGQLTLTYATQIHAAVVEIDPETGDVEIVDYAAVDDCGVRINPQIVEGQVHGATAHAIGAALSEEFVYDENGTLLTAELLRLPRAARDGHAASEDGRDGVPVAGRATRREGHGRRRRRRDPLHLRRDPGRTERRGKRDRLHELQPAA